MTLMRSTMLALAVVMQVKPGTGELDRRRGGLNGTANGLRRK